MTQMRLEAIVVFMSWVATQDFTKLLHKASLGLPQLCAMCLRINRVFYCTAADLLIRKGTSKLRHELLVGFDPVSMLVTQLQQRFQGAAQFFIDTLGGRVLALKWSEKAFTPVPFDATKAYMLEPVIEGQGATVGVQQCVLSISAVLSDVRALGAGLVADVTVHSQN